MTNRLAASTSPYLQQHAENPVDWYEWGQEAFAAARERDVPLLISVGYAACHWCHVMAHESFEDPATAELMNAHFVNVKVDREERPDVDAVYMAATQAMTGHGGWPMTVLATPAGEPFFCGTYFPPRPAHGMPSFPQVLTAVATAWRDRRTDLDTSAAEISRALAQRAPVVVPGGPISRASTDRAAAALTGSFDPVHGGFGGAPKFPPSMVLEWLVRRAGSSASAPEDPSARSMAERTLEAMARGGMHDQLGGGFARYSVDHRWEVPHFEKMLYDNALLLRTYAHWWRVTRSPLARRVVTGVADLLLGELRTPEGGFASALDADSLDEAGHLREGAFYVWSPRQLGDVLGDEDGAWAAQLLGVSEGGTFERGTSVLQMATDPTPDERDRWESVRTRLLAARDRRPRPARDDKVVSGWNGLAVAALAEAGAILDREDWLVAARDAARLLLDVHLRRPDGGPVRLARASRDGRAGHAAGVLEDYAHVADGFLTLAQAGGETAWVAHAGDLLDSVLDRFGAGDGQLYDTADDETDPVLGRIRRPRDVADGPTPAGQAAAAGALLTYAALTGSTRHREAAEQHLAEPVALGEQVPRAAGWGLAAAEALLDGPREVAVVGEPDDPRTAELRRAAWLGTRPGTVVVVGPPGADPGPVGLLHDRGLVDGAPAAYVCRQFVCERPVSSADELAGLLT